VEVGEVSFQFFQVETHPEVAQFELELISFLPVKNVGGLHVEVDEFVLVNYL